MENTENTVVKKSTLKAGVETISDALIKVFQTEYETSHQKCPENKRLNELLEEQTRINDAIEKLDKELSKIEQEMEKEDVLADNAESPEWFQTLTGSELDAEGQSGLYAFARAKKTPAYDNFVNFKRLARALSNEFDVAVDDKERQAIVMRLKTLDFRSMGLEVPGWDNADSFKIENKKLVQK